MAKFSKKVNDSNNILMVCLGLLNTKLNSRRYLYIDKSLIHRVMWIESNIPPLILCIKIKVDILPVYVYWTLKKKSHSTQLYSACCLLYRVFGQCVRRGLYQALSVQEQQRGVHQPQWSLSRRVRVELRQLQLSTVWVDDDHTLDCALRTLLNNRCQPRGMHERRNIEKLLEILRHRYRYSDVETEVR